MKKVCENIVPKQLTEQKQRRVKICQDLSKRHNEILSRVITGAETWVYEYEPEMKGQNAPWKTAFSTSKKVSSVQIKSQNSVANFFDIKGIVHYEFIPTGHTDN